MSTYTTCCVQVHEWHTYLPPAQLDSNLQRNELFSDEKVWEVWCPLRQLQNETVCDIGQREEGRGRRKEREWEGGGRVGMREGEMVDERGADVGREGGRKRGRKTDREIVHQIPL